MGFLLSFGRALGLEATAVAARAMRVCFAQGWRDSIVFIIAQAGGVRRAVVL